MNIQEVKPYNKEKPKKTQVREMFNNISHKYDVTNSVLSFGIHYYWRKKCIEKLKQFHPKYILDLATGTGDLAIALAQLPAEKIIAADYAEKMLGIAHKKIVAKKLNNIIEIKQEDGENLSFKDAAFDAITISFGIRNFEDYQKGLGEMYRVLKENGVLLILEFTLPKNKLMRGLYNFYFKYILPIIAWILTGDKKAYDYLPDSVASFPQYENFCNIIISKGFRNCDYFPLTGGIATIYLARK
ncbi:MAG: demethylmenaquinone methyltransferase [Bacteroidia bacterium]|nr:MAG: demethylmenaquinone methyltransferase [Bacteroidia bacterium]